MKRDPVDAVLLWLIGATLAGLMLAVLALCLMMASAAGPVTFLPMVAWLAFMAVGAVVVAVRSR